jgi:hypothetical protein
MEARLLHFEPAGEFEWLWPSRNIEKFDRSWCGEIVIDGAKYDFRHALGHRHVYGRDRVHSVTWIAGKPTVEGVEADDYGSSRALISLLRRDGKKHARTSDDLPKEYDGFLTVEHRTEVSAPYSPRSLAVKIVGDDVPAWAIHAAVRAATKESYLRKRLP